MGTHPEQLSLAGCGGPSAIRSGKSVWCPSGHAAPCMRLVHVHDSQYGVDRARHSDGLLSIEADRLLTCM